MFTCVRREITNINEAPPLRLIDKVHKNVRVIRYETVFALRDRLLILSSWSACERARARKPRPENELGVGGIEPFRTQDNTRVIYSNKQCSKSRTKREFHVVLQGSSFWGYSLSLTHTHTHAHTRRYSITTMTTGFKRLMRDNVFLHSHAGVANKE